MTSPQEFLEAVRAGDLQVLRRHVRETPSLANARDARGMSALMLAMYHGQADAARLLAEMGAEIGPFEACVLGNADRLTETLAADRDLIGRFSPDGFTLLHLAAFFAQPEIAAMLLKAGADVNAEARNTTRVRPLHSAAAADQTQIALELISHGADVNARQHGGFTVLHAAAKNGNLELVRALLEHGAEVAARTDEGKTAEHYARQANKHQAVSLLRSRK